VAAGGGERIALGGGRWHAGGASLQRDGRAGRWSNSRCFSLGFIRVRADTRPPFHHRAPSHSPTHGGVIPTHSARLSSSFKKSVNLLTHPFTFKHSAFSNPNGPLPPPSCRTRARRPGSGRTGARSARLALARFAASCGGGTRACSPSRAR